MKYWRSLLEHLFIFVAGEPNVKYRRFEWRIDDYYLNRLLGVDISPNGAYHPIYSPLFSIVRKPGQLLLGLYGWNTKCLTLSFSRRPPIFAWAYSDNWELEYEEEE